ncbi:hypothetical protein BJ170DRAFT_157673 [Xylariales sp. AK1849]|nr:hypothetical protein BJ170DRAFT_157673 [Xylariales sp. AK1849]
MCFIMQGKGDMYRWGIGVAHLSSSLRSQYPVGWSSTEWFHPTASHGLRSAASKNLNHQRFCSITRKNHHGTEWEKRTMNPSCGALFVLLTTTTLLATSPSLSRSSHSPPAADLKHAHHVRYVARIPRSLLHCLFHLVSSSSRVRSRLIVVVSVRFFRRGIMFAKVGSSSKRVVVVYQGGGEPGQRSNTGSMHQRKFEIRPPFDPTVPFARVVLLVARDRHNSMERRA